MAISFVIAVYFQFAHTALGFAPLAPTLQLVIGIAVTTVGWLAVTFATPPTDRATLQTFYDRIRPMGRGWDGAVTTLPAKLGESVTAAFLCWFLGCAVIYGRCSARIRVVREIAARDRVPGGRGRGGVGAVPHPAAVGFE